MVLSFFVVRNPVSLFMIFVRDFCLVWCFDRVFWGGILGFAVVRNPVSLFVIFVCDFCCPTLEPCHLGLSLSSVFLSLVVSDSVT